MSTSFPPLPPGRAPTKDSVVCRICGKPVPVNSAKADADERAIHEECYALKVQFEQAGRGDDHTGDSRPWKLIAEEVTREQDPKKMGELVAELNQALDEQRIDGTQKPKF